MRRPTGPWTPAVHLLLRHLEAAGLDGAPRVLGFDARGREVLTHLPGHTITADGEEPSTETLRDAVRWLRRFHTAVTTFRPVGTLSWRHGARALAPAEIICHNDPGVYNWIVSDGRFAGIIDWDIAGPGVPLEDLAFLAWTGVPLSREMPTPNVVRRLRLVADAYGGVDPRLLLHAAGTRMASAAERIAAGQDTGDPGMLALRDLGEPERTRTRVADLRRRVPMIEAALADSP
ncbi:MAG: phosphotransferase [Actinomycetota bacterium]|nr:phosphotransferase [Actinomycetota bacterium]